MFVLISKQSAIYEKYVEIPLHLLLKKNISSKLWATTTETFLFQSGTPFQIFLVAQPSDVITLDTRWAREGGDDVGGEKVRWEQEVQHFFCEWNLPEWDNRNLSADILCINSVNGYGSFFCPLFQVLFYDPRTFPLP